MNYFPVGKLDYRLLEKLLNLNPIKDPRIIVRSKGLARMLPSLTLERSTSLPRQTPLRFTTHRIGWYAVNINANDIANDGGNSKMVPGNVTAARRKDECKTGNTNF